MAVVAVVKHMIGKNFVQTWTLKLSAVFVTQKFLDLELQVMVNSIAKNVFALNAVNLAVANMDFDLLKKVTGQ